MGPTRGDNTPFGQLGPTACAKDNPLGTPYAHSLPSSHLPLTPNTAWSGFLHSDAITKKSRCAAQAFLITAP